MSRSQRHWWWIFSACAAGMVGALGFITVTVLRLEKAEMTARADADHQETLRLALWRMDSWLAPLLAREAARPYFEYAAYYPQQKAYTKMLGEIEAGEVLTPSPLLTFRSEFFRLHFQLSSTRGLTSPQVPAGSQLDLAEASCIAPGEVRTRQGTLDDIRPYLNLEELRRKLARAEEKLKKLIGEYPESPGSSPAPRNAQQTAGPATKARGQQEFQSRAQTTYSSKKGSDAGDEVAKPAPDEALGVTPGPLVPIWLSGDEGSRGDALFFIRRVKVQKEEVFQGFAAEWSRLSEATLAQAKDLFPEARLAPVKDDAGSADAPSCLLATVPALLEVTRRLPSAALSFTPTRAILAIAWLAVGLAIVTAGFTLRASIAFGERRGRFASAVTHELRTPLTTFRMYSEMLADGIVKDEAQRTLYHGTLKKESERLSRLVENVLTYARLEEGRYAGRRERLSVQDLVERIAPALMERAKDSGRSLSIEAAAAGGVSVEVDVDAVSQILFNLVDNACKYAEPADSPLIHLAAEARAGKLALRVRDHGPGIPAAYSRKIFDPFERGSLGVGNSRQPGVGLGLALARGLARDIDGDLILETTAERGACFLLTVPLSAAT